MTIRYANDYPVISPGLGRAFKTYSKIQILILTLGGSITIMGVFGYFSFMFSYRFDFYPIYFVLIVLVLLGNQILGWVYLNKLTLSLEQLSRSLKNKRFNKAIKQFRFSINFHLARLIVVILIGVVWVFPGFFPVFNTSGRSYRNVNMVIFLSGLVVFGLDLTGSIFKVLAYESIKSWVNESIVRHPQLVELREIESGMQSLKFGLIFRIISPVLFITYIGILLLLIGWAIYLVGLHKTADIFYKIETEGYSVAHNPYGGQPYPPQYPQNARSPPSNTGMPNTIQTDDTGANFCSNCGSRLPRDAKFCVQCGTDAMR